MADALSDFVTLTQAAGSLIGSLEHLQNTRVQLEGARLSAEMSQMNSSFLMDMNRKAGDPKKITIENWREKLSYHNSKVQARLGTIKSPMVRTMVDASLAEMSDGFMVSITNGMVKQEIEMGQQDFDATVYAIANDGAKSAEERDAELRGLFAKTQDPNDPFYMIRSQSDLRNIDASVRIPLAAEILAKKADRDAELAAGAYYDKEVEEYNKEAPAGGGEAPVLQKASYEDAAFLLSQSNEGSQAERSMATQSLIQRQKDADEEFNAQFKSIVTDRAKDKGPVNIDMAMNLIYESKASRSVKQSAALELNSYIFSQQEAEANYQFNNILSMPEAQRAAPAFKAEASKVIMGMSEKWGWAATVEGQDQVEEWLKQIDGWNMDGASLEAAKLAAQNDLVSLKWKLKNGTLSPEAYLAASAALKPLIPKEVDQAWNGFESGELILTPSEVKDLFNENGLLAGITTLMARRDSTMPKSAKDFIIERDKQGENNNYVADQQWKTLLPGIIRDVINEKRKTGGSLDDALKSQAVQGAIIKALGESQTAFAPIKVDNFGGFDRGVAQAILDGFSLDSEGKLKLGQETRFQQVSAKIMEDAKALKINSDNDVVVAKPDGIVLVTEEQKFLVSVDTNKRIRFFPAMVGGGFSSTPLALPSGQGESKSLRDRRVIK